MLKGRKTHCGMNTQFGVYNGWEAQEDYSMGTEY